MHQIICPILKHNTNDWLNKVHLTWWKSKYRVIFFWLSDCPYMGPWDKMGKPHVTYNKKGQKALKIQVVIMRLLRYGTWLPNKEIVYQSQSGITNSTLTVIFHNDDQNQSEHVNDSSVCVHLDCQKNIYIGPLSHGNLLTFIWFSSAAQFSQSV